MAVAGDALLPHKAHCALLVTTTTNKHNVVLFGLAPRHERRNVAGG